MDGDPHRVVGDGDFYFLPFSAFLYCLTFPTIYIYEFYFKKINKDCMGSGFMNLKNMFPYIVDKCYFKVRLKYYGFHKIK